ncbi:guanine-N(1)--methyltransferase [Amylocarpus encephaloides]|uniref:tRNA (guanine(9)-N1)-methyltransferase n=1 Tax=Amylocarpus encephaloides TaxID=45428 RepID=A0A9P7YRF6_9HELO|nr:guanine-N(1)--methyltransferase [Amylocarpus encephaloides]
MSDIDERPSKIRKITSSDETSEAAVKIEVLDKELPETETRESPVPTVVQSEDRKDHGNDHQETSESVAQLVLSKSQQKKKAKKAAWEAGKEWRREKRRTKHQEKKLRKAEAKAELLIKITNGEIVAPVEEPRQHNGRIIQVPLALILDCDFNDYMTEKELISLGAQLTRCHSDNRRSLYKSHLAISSWDGALRHRFETVLTNNHLSWKGVRFTEKDFEGAAADLHAVMRSQEGGKLAGALAVEGGENKEEKNNDAPEAEEAPSEGQLQEQSVNIEATSKPSIVYLSSDSPYTLDRLSPNTSYIIGGIVDKNRHKGLCYKRACERGIPTAKLPIGEYMTMQSRTVLTVNHVMEIMLKWLETGDWGEAFLKVIPKRKEAKLKKSKSGSRSVDAESEDEKEEENEQDGDGHGEDRMDVEQGTTATPKEKDIQPQVNSIDDDRLTIKSYQG